MQVTQIIISRDGLHSIRKLVHTLEYLCSDSFAGRVLPDKVKVPHKRQG